MSGSPADHSEQPTDSVDLLADASLEQLAPTLANNPETRSTLLSLRDLQREHDSVFSDYIRAKQEVENRFEQLFAPLYSRRRDELQASAVDNFWYTAFENCEMLRENITERDAVALRYLSDVSCETVTMAKASENAAASVSQASSPGSNSLSVLTSNLDAAAAQDTDLPHASLALPVGSFTLRFRFRDNPFFENDVLTKTYVMHQDDFEDLAEARGCKILWRSGKDLTVRVLKKKAKSGRVLVKKQPTDSFFNFFSPPQGVNDGDGEVDDELAEELEDVMEADLELGECIRSEVIPRALLYFLDIAEGHAESDDDTDEDDDEDDDSDDDDDDDDDDDEDDGDVRGGKRNTSKSSKKGRSAGAKGANGARVVQQSGSSNTAAGSSGSQATAEMARKLAATDATKAPEECAQQ